MAYESGFISGRQIPLPQLGNRVLGDSLTGENFIDHLRYSLLFHKIRGFALCTAHNIDGDTLPTAQHTSRSFRFDPLIKPNNLQVDNDRGYSGSSNKWDRGHLARRKSLSWGAAGDAAIAERESDYYSNIAPQHETLHDTAWGKIEDWMLERAVGGQHRACVFTGPVFTADDPFHQNGPNEDPIQIPAGFWKIIATEHEGLMRAAGFLLWQRDYDSVAPLPFSPALEQVRLTTIEVLTGLNFPTLRSVDPLLFDRDQNPRLASSTTDLTRGIDRLERTNERANAGATNALPIAPPVISSMHDILL